MEEKDLQSNAVKVRTAEEHKAKARTRTSDHA